MVSLLSAGSTPVLVEGTQALRGGFRYMTLFELREAKLWNGTVVGTANRVLIPEYICEMLFAGRAGAPPASLGTGITLEEWLKQRR
jgi:hypothetical protein